MNHAASINKRVNTYAFIAGKGIKNGEYWGGESANDGLLMDYPPWRNKIN